MYRKGLTAARITAACGAIPQTVTRHVSVQRGLYPELETEHPANRPAVRPLPAGPGWRAHIDALYAYRIAHGRYPTRSDPDPTNRRLAHWLSLQRRADRDGRLPANRRMMLSVLPGWSNNQLSEEAAERWKARINEVKAFREQVGRWPRFRNSMDEAGRVLGGRLHAQRQNASRAQLGADEQLLLDITLPGWNTWGRKQQTCVSTVAMVETNIELRSLAEGILSHTSNESRDV